MSNTPIRSQNQQTPDGFSIQNPQWNPKPRWISIFFQNPVESNFVSKTLLTCNITSKAWLSFLEFQLYFVSIISPSVSLCLLLLFLPSSSIILGAPCRTQVCLIDQPLSVPTWKYPNLISIWKVVFWATMLEQQPLDINQVTISQTLIDTAPRYIYINSVLLTDWTCILIWNQV